MSILTNPQGRPERIWSLLRLLEAFGESGEGFSSPGLSRQEIQQWLIPSTFSNLDATAFSNTVSCAAGLGLVQRSRSGIYLNCSVPENRAAFSDLLHERLLSAASTVPTQGDSEDEEDGESAGPNRVLMQVYAFFIVMTEKKGGFSWIKEGNSKSLAESIDAGLPRLSQMPEGKRQFNPTRLSPWRAWMIYLGLGQEGVSLPWFYPTVTERLKRELSFLGKNLGFNQELKADDFLDALAVRMPYLDRGHLFGQLSEVNNCPPNPFISRVLSNALRELHQDKVIEMKVLGDSGGIRLTHDPTTKDLNMFHGLIIHQGG
ncbi:MAG: hypothetical protein ACO1RX_08275 [Candidatus Sericytochromatia bacterium]